MIPHTTSFYVDREKGGTEGKLRMRVRWDRGRSVAVNLGHRVDSQKWSMESQRAVANTTHGRKKIPAYQINHDIQSCEDAADEAFRHFDSLGIDPSVEEYKAELRRLLGKQGDPVSDSPLLRSVLASFISKESAIRSWSQHTERIWRELLSSFDKFDPELTIAGFDGKRFEEFYLWMTEEMGYANRTIKQRLMAVKQFIRWSLDSGYDMPADSLAFKPRIKVAPKSVVWLNWEELQTLLRHRDSGRLNSQWRDVLDCFLLSCFTGLRVSDIGNLRWSDVGQKSIRVLTSKTTDPLVIELNKYSRALIDCHRDDPRCAEFVMPRIDRINTPATLKRICRDAGLDSEVTIQEMRGGNKRVEVVKKKWEVVSMHTGRRSFICNALSLGIPHLTVMKWTGHTDYNSMKPYIGIASADKEQAMSLFDSK